MLIRTVLLCITILLATPGWGRPQIDKIVMKNGDRFTCEIKKLDQGVLYANFDYVDGTVSLDWTKVARVESPQEFLVQTAGGIQYTGTLRMAETLAEEPVKIDIVTVDNTAVPLQQLRIAEMAQTSQNFWRRFSGNVNSGLMYTRANNTTQYNFGSGVDYRKEHWSASGTISSTLSASSGVKTSTRNQVNFGALRMLRRSNWFYSGLGGFLQSSQQSIQLQTSLGAGLGRYITNSHRSRISVIGGFAWQGTKYAGDNASFGEHKLVAGYAAAGVQIFRFKKTTLDLAVSTFPAISELGRVRTYVNSTYKIQVINNLWWNFTFYGNWDNKPPAGLSGSDYGTSSGLTYTFSN
jgi:hypothetical protein